MSQQSTSQNRRPTRQELREIQITFELEQCSDDYFTTKMGKIIRSLQFDAAEIVIRYDFLYESSRQKEELALLAWREQNWVMVMKRWPNSGSPRICWLCGINGDWDELRQDAYADETV